MDILGISCYFHDAAAALLRDGQLIAAAEEERFSRKKHDYGFPAHAIDFCLRAGGIPASALDYVVFFEKPFLKFERLLLTCMQTFPRSRRLFQEAMIPWLGDKLWIRHLIQTRLGVPADKILFSEHHLSHAASAFFCSPFAEAAILTVDGVGEWATATVGVGRGTDITLLEEIRFPHSLGLLYSAFTAFLGFEVNEGEYKVMGMAPFGAPRYVDEVWKLIRAADDGGFELDMELLLVPPLHRAHVQRPVRGAVRRAARPAAALLHGRQRLPSYFGPRAAGPRRRRRERNQHYADVAASIQAVAEEVVLRWRGTLTAGRACAASAWPAAWRSTAWPTAASSARRPSRSSTSSRRRATGAGRSAPRSGRYHAVLGRPRGFVMEHAAWGQEYGRPEIEAASCAADGASPTRRSTTRTGSSTASSTGSSRARSSGGSRVASSGGPRALGNRSILADPRRPDMKDIVNTKIKFREPFRPVRALGRWSARAEEYFDLPEAARHYPARFMLYVVDVHDDKRDAIPAITHVDGTARLQTVREETAPRYHRLIERFGKATGVPVVLNTSFNLKGEPIVNTPAEAFSTFIRSGMDVLVLGDYVVEKRAGGGSEP